MMKYFFAFGALISFICAIFCGKLGELSSEILKSGPKAIELILILAGGICFWSGIMNVAKDSGLTTKLSKLFSPILKFIFKNPSEKAIEAMSLNISSNILGLANAATPFGIEAMRQLKLQNNNKNTATYNMILFCVLNTSSVQIIPTTVLTLRIAHGSLNAFSIFLPTLISSFGSLIICLIFVKFFSFCLKDKT